MPRLEGDQEVFNTGSIPFDAAQASRLSYWGAFGRPGTVFRPIMKRMSSYLRSLCERFVLAKTSRPQVLMSVSGLWKDRKDLLDTETYLRRLRKGNRLKRLVL